jgi:hypothetical protein
MKSTIRCNSPRCIDEIKKYGEQYHKVHDVESPPYFMPEAIAMCERCGGYSDGEHWKYTCKICKKDVKAGELVGFFVPSRCKECDKKVVDSQRNNGEVCKQCHQVFAYCCC